MIADKQQEFVREHREEAARYACRRWAAEKPFVVYYIDLRAEPPSEKPEERRFAERGEAEDFAHEIVSEWVTAAASIWEDVPRGLVIGATDV